MGWSRANDVFDPVARSLIELGAPDEMKTRVLGILIEALQEGDWDTEDESLERFKDDPAIVAAFREHDVIVTCGAEADEHDDADECALERDHEGKHRDWRGREFQDAS